MQRTAGILQKCIAVAIWGYLICLLVIMPLYFTDGYARIGTDKGVFYRQTAVPVLAVSAVLLVLWQLCRKPVWQKERCLSLTDLLVLAYMGAVFCSWLCSDYRAQTGLWGNESWPMGLLTHLCVGVSYFVLSRGFSGVSREGRILEWLLLGVTTVVFGLGVLNRFGVYPLEMAYANYSFLSTVGNMNWFCGYWSVVSWVSVIGYWAHDRQEESGAPSCRKLWLLVCRGLLVTVALALGILQGSDSGLLALGAVLLALFWASAEDERRMCRFWELLLMISGICLLTGLVRRWVPGIYLPGILQVLTRIKVAGGVLFAVLVIYVILRRWGSGERFCPALWRFAGKGLLLLVGAAMLVYVLLLICNTLLPAGITGLAGKPLFTFDAAWGSNRGGTWSAGLRVWTGQDLLHKLVGTGPDAMMAYIYSGADGELLQQLRVQFPGSRLYNAHGEWITNLANWGILGMTAFAGVMVSAFCRFWKAAEKKPYMYFFAVSVLAYTVNNSFSFQTMMNLPFVFVVLGIGEGLLRKSK